MIYPFSKISVAREHKEPDRTQTDGAFTENPLVCVCVRVCTWVINPSLNDIIQGKSTGCLLAPQPLVQGRSQDLGHVVVVLAQVRVLLLRGVLHLQLVVRVPEGHDCSLRRRRMEGGREGGRDGNKATMKRIS